MVAERVARLRGWFETDCQYVVSYVLVVCSQRFPCHIGAWAGPRHYIVSSKYICTGLRVGRYGSERLVVKLSWTLLDRELLIIIWQLFFISIMKGKGVGRR